MRDAPERIGHYVVERQLGSGGMGEVFLAFSPAGEPVAVKLIRNDRLDPVTRQRFEREALIARTVVGTSRVARFLGADPFEQRPWMAMEFIQGATLAEHVDRQGALPDADVASLGALLTEGLQAVHATGLVHRDLKPQNVIMSPHGPVLIDFGLGTFVDTTHDSLSQSGMIIGTVRCMPPEQADGHPHVTSAADIYGLGAVLLFAATGHYPYEAPSWQAVVAQIISPNREPNLEGVSPKLIPLLAPMLAHEPSDRPSLSAITERCADVFSGCDLSPAQARNALIDRTAVNSGWPTPGPAATKLLDARSVSVADDVVPDSPRDRPSGIGTESSNERPGDEGDAPATADDAPDATASGGRLLASQRIAEQLRQQYAAQSAL
ncbi:serine/threonine-protein kinase [Nocardia xishanensis]|uniref:serine/threonine-protein kinase n=1 Tax=Nocardia xishanensis TaxID=238964 RepID=UPI00340735D8